MKNKKDDQIYEIKFIEMKVKQLFIKDESIQLNFREIQNEIFYLSIIKNKKYSLKYLSIFFPNLVTLKLPNNHVTLKFKENYEFLLLQYLDLSYNHINDISILNSLNVTSLYYLDLTANPINILIPK